MKSSFIVVVFFQIFFVSSIRADVNPTVRSIPIERAFFIDGFDDTDVAQIVVKGVFPSTCYQMGPTDLWVNHSEQRIEVRQLSYLYEGNCLRMTVPFQQTIDLGVLRASSYSVVDTKAERELGKLVVRPTPEGGVGTDDYLYAPLQDAYIEGVRRQPTLVLKGSFANSCLRLERTQIRFKNDVLIVQPVAGFNNGSKCEVGNFPFVKRIRLKESFHSEFLMHARSMNGQAINKIYQP